MLYSILFIRLQGKEVVSSAVNLEMQAYQVLLYQLHCSAVTMPIKLSSYAIWSTSEMTASVQLPLNSIVLLTCKVLSHVIV